MPKNPKIIHNGKLKKLVVKCKPMPAKNIGINIPCPNAFTLLEISRYSFLFIREMAIPNSKAPIAP